MACAQGSHPQQEGPAVHPAAGVCRGTAGSFPCQLLFWCWATTSALLVEQVEYHYFHQTNITVPRDMLEVLSGLQTRDLRVFHVEPNYWWHNYAQEFIEFAYVQVSAQDHTLSAQWAVCASPLCESWGCTCRLARSARL